MIDSFNEDKVSRATFDSFVQALEMHSEALESTNVKTVFRNFWIALESLFSTPAMHGAREDVPNGVCFILQKTFLLKKLRIIYNQVSSYAKDEELRNLGIEDFVSFVDFFCKNNEKSEESKKFYSLLSSNPLLRSRCFLTRESLSTSKKISEELSVHQKRINWHIKRLQRMRNIATHLGFDYPGMETAVNHLHNYFDYVVNYILCKIENKEAVPSFSSLVFEAKSDLQVQNTILSKDVNLSQDNYKDLLFGIDHNLMNYTFEGYTV